ncbi:MAG: amino acid ABC transporter permease [SAR324 cluster bacterium]|nr:amino acid ABC transporter permease [SAR324 cluster bacterium]
MNSELTSAIPPLEVGPPKMSIGVAGWIKKNLFNNWYNAILTLLSLCLIYFAGSGLLSWGVQLARFAGSDPQACQGIEGACWPVIKDNWAFFMVGIYPFELRWRPLAALLLVAGLTLLAVSPQVRRMRGYHLAWFAAPLAVFFIIKGSESLGLQPVETRLWGGLMLTIILSVVGIVVAFPAGLALALGRQSKMPLIRLLSICYIELIRGVPLITVLFMSSIMLPLFFPEGFNLDKVLRAQVGIILFAAAYQAEVVRGGLQGVEKGQAEAAAALGLGYWQTMVLIILPQALKIVIPSLVSGAISLLKDTSLVVIIGLFDLLGVANLVLANPIWLGKMFETYIFVAALYWVMCFSMSRYARRLEIKFSAGGR